MSFSLSLLTHGIGAYRNIPSAPRNQSIQTLNFAAPKTSLSFQISLLLSLKQKPHLLLQTQEMFLQVLLLFDKEKTEA